MVAENRWYATGKRKRSIARVWMTAGKGKIIINKKAEDVYFPRAISRMIMRQPLGIVDADEKYDFLINVHGGGLAGQADAIKHGISKVLCIADIENRPTLKKAGFLTRDARVVERKKYGQPGARKHFQYSKR